MNMSDILSVQEALERMMKRFLPVPTATLPIERARGMILADQVISTTYLPPFNNSGMDGFAVIASDIETASAENPVQLIIVMDVPAGVEPLGVLHTGEAARIMTGACLPMGADTVIPIEDTNFSQVKTNFSLPARVSIQKSAAPGAYIRPKGQDLLPGQLIFKIGHKLRPQDLGMLASLGLASIRVYRQPRVALLSSGDELVSPTEPLSPGKIHDSNSYTLAALCEQAGAEVVRLGVVRDDPDLIRERLEIAIDRSVDLIITSAGVSVGAFDYIRQVIEESGNLNFWRVNMRPGKPLAFGSFRGIPLIGLPGNPVSAYVGFQVFVIPVLSRLSGQPDHHRPTVKAVLDQAVESDGRESYLRGVLIEKCGKITATLASHQGSGNLYSLVKANGLIIVPAGITSLAQGSEIDAWLLEEDWSGHE
jgi:molybdopterin molybdotransferase